MRGLHARRPARATPIAATHHRNAGTFSRVDAKAVASAASANATVSAAPSSANTRPAANAAIALAVKAPRPRRVDGASFVARTIWNRLAPAPHRAPSNPAPEAIGQEGRASAR